MTSLETYRERLITLDPKITRYFPYLDTPSGILTATRKSKDWAVSEGNKVTDLDQLIADLETIITPKTPPPSTVRVTIKPIVELDELYCRDPHRTTSQRVYMRLYLEDGDLTIVCDPVGDNGMPASVAHRRTLCWEVPCLTANAANSLLDEVAPIAQLILDGSEIYWDGETRRGHQVTTTATEAIDEINEVIKTYGTDEEVLKTFPADEWYVDGDPTAIAHLEITANTTDEALDQLAATEVRDALSDQVVLTGAEEYFRTLREELRDVERDELDTVGDQLISLTTRRDELIVRQLAWGDSTRAIGDRAGLSHTRVQAIGKS